MTFKVVRRPPKPRRPARLLVEAICARIPETGPLFVGPNFVPRYNAVNLHPDFFCHFERISVLLRRPMAQPLKVQ